MKLFNSLARNYTLFQKYSSIISINSIFELKTVSTTFFVVYFASRAIVTQGKMLFYFTSKAVFVFEIIKY